MPPFWRVVPGQSLGPVRLGTTLQQAVAHLGPADNEWPEGDRLTVHWHRSGMRADFGRDGSAEFLELSWEAGGPEPHHRGLDLLNDPAEVVGRLLVEHEAGKYTERDYAVECATGLAVWRPVLDGDPDDEYRGGRCWATVAVAAPGYWDV